MNLAEAVRSIPLVLSRNRFDSSNTINSTNADVYPSWGRNRTRIDSPFFGPEFAEWKRRVPPDAQKTLLDFLEARRIAKLREVGGKMDGFSYLCQEVAERKINGAIKKTEKIADEFYKFFMEVNPYEEFNLGGVILSGSSLYRPTRESDLDIWVLFKCPGVGSKDTLAYFCHKKYLTFLVQNVNIHHALLYPSYEEIKDDGLLPVLAFPHRLIRLFSIQLDEYQRAVCSSVELAVEAKRDIYCCARGFSNSLSRTRTKQIRNTAKAT